MILTRASFLLLLAISVVACGFGSETDGVEDRLLARVHNKELRISELEGMFPAVATKEDSTLIIQAFVNRWIKDAVIQVESEQNMPADLNIDRLVRDYRSSLLRSTYEKVLVGELMDSSISKQELLTYYEENKEQYQLEKPIIRCLFIKVPHPTPEAEVLRSAWNNGEVEDMGQLQDYANRFAEIALLKKEAWYSLDEVAAQFPDGALTAGNVRSMRDFSQQDGQYRYYFSILEFRNRLEIAPLEYVTEQARRVILHNRKMKVLEDAKEEIFQRELRRQNVETFMN
ncbi:hypothetical protein CEQ90_19085 [Lewinellaceae bacterium SD302]|nr:hypothetical protein CEQ90_19085 [Lewinellaceae bacterium SD302]